VLRQRGVILLASCSATCTLSATGAVALAGASRTLGLRAISRSAQSGQQVRLRLTLSAKTLRAVRRALRRGKKPVARVTVVASDAAGNSAKTTRRINLRR
jgi:hypothetical protein